MAKYIWTVKLLQNILFILNLYHKDKGKCLICLRYHKYNFERNLENIRPILVNNLLERGRTTSVENGSKMVIGQMIKLINQWNRENTKSVCFKIWRYIWIHKIEDGEMNSIHCVKFTNYSFIIIFKKMDLHSGCNWLMHRIKHHKDNQLLPILRVICIML